jgi:hypothetical protein
MVKQHRVCWRIISGVEAIPILEQGDVGASAQRSRRGPTEINAYRKTQ